MPEKINCDYGKAKPYRCGPFVLCNVNKEQCPYNQSVKMASEDKPVFRCARSGKVEKLVKQDTTKQ